MNVTIDRGWILGTSIIGAGLIENTVCPQPMEDDSPRIARLMIPPSLKYRLKGIGVLTLKDISKITREDVLALKNVGPQALRKLLLEMDDYGYHFADE